MPAQRIKGQEVSVVISAGGSVQDTLTDTQDFGFTLQFEIKVQGYLGEATNRHDEIFNGVKGDGTLHMHTQDVFSYLGQIKDRAQRKSPLTVFNLTGVFSFPNGDTPNVLLPDVKFGEAPFKAANRSDYVNYKMDYACDDCVITLT